MTEEYNKALNDQLEANIWDTLKQEATSLKPAEYAQLTADIAGIFDPSPISDTAGLGLSLWNGDWLGAGISVVGYVPYLGDTLKPVKIALLAPRTAKAIEGFMRAGDNLAKAGKEVLEQTFNLKQVAAARQTAAKKVREAIMRCRNNPNSRACKGVLNKNGKPIGAKMPASDSTKGKWIDSNGNRIDQPADGNGKFRVDAKDPVTGEVTPVDIEWKDGFPDYGPHVNGEKLEIWEVTGNMHKDETQFAEMMRAKDPNWDPPEYSTLHHFEDGTVGYVPRNIHSGVNHTGGRAITDNDLF